MCDLNEHSSHLGMLYNRYLYCIVHHGKTTARSIRTGMLGICTGHYFVDSSFHTQGGKHHNQKLLGLA